MKIRHSEDPAALRKRAYPPVGDQLDAVMKLAKALSEQGITLPAEVTAWVDQCQAVKEKFKKRS